MTSTALILFFAAAQAHDPIDDRGGAAPTAEAETAAAAPAKDAEEADAAKPDWDVLVPHGAHHSARFTLTEGTWMSVSVSGDSLVFDLLGDLWSMPLSGGKAQRLTADAAWDSEARFSPDGRRIAFVSDRDGNEQIWVMDRDGGNLHKVTDEDEARVTDPVWDPTGDWLIVRRRTVDTRSIGVTELWRVHVDGGTPGFPLTSLDEHPHAGESSTDGRFVYFSNRHGRFNYDEDPVAGLWDVQRLDLQTNEVRTVVHGAGSASRPKLSPDGKTLAFISRDRSHTLLELMDLATGRRRTLSQDLDHDQLEGFALHGTYPDISWLPDGSGLVLWARGQLWKLGLDGTEATIPFEATGSWDFHDVQRWKRTIPDTVQARVIRWPVRSKDGRLAFSAMGRLWTQDPGGEIQPASSGTGYSPAWSPDGKRLAWTSWTDCPAPETAVTSTPAPDCGGRLHLSQGKKLETLPVEGLLINPAWSPDGKTLVVLRGVGGSSSPDLGSQPWYEIVRLTEGKKGRWDSVVIGSTDIDQFRAPRPTIVGDRIYWAESRPTEPRRPGKAVLVSVDLDGDDKIEHLSLGGAQEVRLSPTGKRVAFKRGHQAWVADVPPQMRDLDVDALPHRKLTEEVGDWLEWSPDGRELSWMAGNRLNRLVVDTVTLPEKAEAPKPQQDELMLSLPRQVPAGSLALTHATVLTMEPDGQGGVVVLDDATVVIEGDRIRSVGSSAPPPAGARVIDATGKIIIPGLVDVHAHLHYSAGDVLPAQEWRYLVNLDFGVTTVHDPSASTDLVFTQKERVEVGFERGPRIHSTGYILYGALDNDAAITKTPEDALAHVRRIKAAGGQSVKVYQQSRRDQRQWYVQACDAEEILCVAEGGGDLWMNLGMVADGIQAVEHALPIAPLYADVKQWMAASQSKDSFGSAYTPTLLVAYGGIGGENYFYQHENPRDNARLLRHHPRRLLDARAWRPGLMAADEDWNHMQVAREAAAMARDGVLVTLGAHGQLQGLGAHWEMWALASEGAMTPLEALSAATLQGARYLGLEDQLGTVTAGKLADLVVLDADPRADIRNSDDIFLVIKNGVPQPSSGPE